MTTREFAKQLLSMPNLPIAVPKVIEYEDNPDDSCADPIVSIVDAHENGTPRKIALISYAANTQAEPRPGKSPKL